MEIALNDRFSLNFPNELALMACLYCILLLLLNELLVLGLLVVVYALIASVIIL